MDAIKVNSVNDIKGPGIYKIPYVYKGRKYSYIVTVDDTLNPNSGITLTGYGQGQFSDTKLLNNYLNNNHTNAVNVVLTGANGENGYKINNWQEATSTFMNDLSTQLNVSPNNSTLIGFSLSAERTAKYAAQYAQQTGAKDFYAVIIEASCVPPTKLTEAERQSLINNNVTLLNVYQNKASSLTNPAHFQNYEGVHMLDLNIKITNKKGDMHVLPFDMLVDNGIINLGNGNFSFSDLPSEYTMRRHGATPGTFKLEYEFIEHYVDENGNYVERTLTMEEANKLIANNRIDISGSPDGFRIKETDSPVMDKYWFLNDLSKLSLTPPKGGVISSSMEYVASEMNDLRGKISSAEFLTSLKSLSFRSSEGIPGCIGTYIEAYYDLVGELYTKLADETSAVISVAQAVSDMDAAIARGDTNIGSIVPWEQAPITIPEYSSNSLLHKNFSDRIYPITAEDLDKLFVHWSQMKKNPNSPLLGTGKYFIEAADKYGIDPLALVGICGMETGRGGTGGMPRMRYGNFFGTNFVYKSTDPNSPDYNKRISWTSKRGWNDIAHGDPREGIMFSADCISRFYRDLKGANSVYELDKIGYNGTKGAGGYSKGIADVMKTSLDYIIENSSNTGTRGQPTTLTSLIGTPNPHKPTTTPVTTTPTTTTTTPISTTPVRTTPVVTTPTGPTTTTTTPTHPVQTTIEELVSTDPEEFQTVIEVPTEPTSPVSEPTTSEPVVSTPTPEPVSSPPPSVSPEPTPTYYEEPTSESYDTGVPVYSHGDNTIDTVYDKSSTVITDDTINSVNTIPSTNIPTPDTTSPTEDVVSEPTTPEPAPTSDNTDSKGSTIGKVFGLSAAALAVGGAAYATSEMIKKKKENDEV